MKNHSVALVIATVLLLSGMIYGLATANASGSDINTFDTSTNGITNFTVHANSQSIVVFKYFNVSGSSRFLNLPHISEDSTTSLFWQGIGNVSITPAIPFSSVGNVSYPGYTLQYVCFYQPDYLGFLFTTGQIHESGGKLSIIDQNVLQGIKISYVNAPLSQFDFTQNSYAGIGNTYSGNYSSFSFVSGAIRDFSLVNQQSSVSVISSVATSSGSNLSFSTKDLAVPGKTVMFASDSLFPMLYLDSFNSTVDIQLSSGFHFGNMEVGRNQGGNTDQGNNSDQDPSISSEFPIYQEHIFRIMYGHETLGYIDAYGSASVSQTSLVVNSQVSFVLIRFLPSFQSTNATNHSNSRLENATTEIYVGSQAYFVPFSPNITSQNLSFGSGKLYFQFEQNGTQQFVVVVQGNFSVSEFELTGNGSNTTQYSVTRTGNQTLITFSTAGSGQRNLSLSIVPAVGGVNDSPLIALILSATALVIVSASLIVYSRKRWESKFEKE